MISLNQRDNQEMKRQIEASVKPEENGDVTGDKRGQVLITGMTQQS